MSVSGSDPLEGDDTSESSGEAHEVARRQPVPPSTTCNALTRSTGVLCNLPAGHGTNHPGQGRCKNHGGAVPIKSGRYSLIKRDRIRELIEKCENMEDPLNLTPEVAALRALFVDFIDRYDEMTEALLAWHAVQQIMRIALPESMVTFLGTAVEDWEQTRLKSDAGHLTEDDRKVVKAARDYIDILRRGPDEKRPKTVLDIGDAHKMLDSVGRMVERIEKIRSQNAISRPDLNRVMQQMFITIEMRVRDENVKQEIVNDWMRIQL